jgi:hypothetical protein
MDNGECERHAKKQISPNVMNNKKTKLPIWIDKHTLPSTMRRRCEGRCRCGSGVESNLFAWVAILTTPMMHHNRQPLTLTKEWRNKVPHLLPTERQGEREMGPTTWPVDMGGSFPPPSEKRRSGFVLAKSVSRQQSHLFACIFTSFVQIC